MGRRLRSIFLAVFALAALFVSAKSVEDLSKRKYRLEVLYLPSGRFLEQVSLQYKNLAADVLWFRMVQYYGGYRMGQNDLEYFKHLANVITDLDPQFTFVYVFGALIMVEDLGSFDEGVSLLEKGIAKNPEDWRLPFERGFLEYVYSRNFESAFEHFKKAASMPNADPIAARFAAFVAARAGYIETSLAMWRELARTSDNRYIRELAERYIEKLERGETIMPRFPDDETRTLPSSPIPGTRNGSHRGM